MRFRTFIMALLFAGVLPTGAYAFEGEFSGNVGLVSDYAFRGISQSDESPALQGGVDYSHDSGFYAGLWGSSVDFNDGDEASVEADIYAGFAGAFDNGIAWDVGAIHYMYPGADSSLDYDFTEAAVSLGYDFGVAVISGAFNYSPDFFGGSGDATYTAAYLDVPLPHSFSVSAHLGHQTIEDTPDYTDWSLGIGYNWNAFDFSLKYVDTSLDEPSECADGCDSRIIGGIGYSF